MLRTKMIEDQLRKGRLEAKTLDNRPERKQPGCLRPTLPHN